MIDSSITAVSAAQPKSVYRRVRQIVAGTLVVKGCLGDKDEPAELKFALIQERYAGRVKKDGLNIACLCGAACISGT